MANVCTSSDVSTSISSIRRAFKVHKFRLLFIWFLILPQAAKYRSSSASFLTDISNSRYVPYKFQAQRKFLLSQLEATSADYLIKMALQFWVFIKPDVVQINLKMILKRLSKVVGLSNHQLNGSFQAFFFFSLTGVQNKIRVCFFTQPYKVLQ